MSKQDLSDSLIHGHRGCFLGESSLKSRSGGLTVVVIFFFSTQTVGELKFFAGDRRSTYNGDIFPSYKLPKTVTVTLLLFGPVTLLCGTFLLI